METERKHQLEQPNHSPGHSYEAASQGAMKRFKLKVGVVRSEPWVQVTQDGLGAGLGAMAWGATIKKADQERSLKIAPRLPSAAFRVGDMRYTDQYLLS